MLLCDDAFISMRYARNLAGGQGLVWNPGQPPVEGFTSPAWVLLMAVFIVMFTRRFVGVPIRRLIDGTREMLSELAEAPEVRVGHAPRTTTLFSLSMRQWRGYAGFALVDLDGRIVVGVPAPRQPAVFSDRAWFQQALRSGEFSTGDDRAPQGEPPAHSSCSSGRQVG